MTPALLKPVLPCSSMLHASGYLLESSSVIELISSPYWQSDLGLLARL
jgi:hypothetical protein